MRLYIHVKRKIRKNGKRHRVQREILLQKGQVSPAVPGVLRVCEIQMFSLKTASFQREKTHTKGLEESSASKNASLNPLLSSFFSKRMRDAPYVTRNKAKYNFGGIFLEQYSETPVTRHQNYARFGQRTNKLGKSHPR
jgi:hypothetical protein